MKKLTTIFISLALLASVAPALAQTTSSTTDIIQSLLNQIQQLQQQLNQLQQQKQQAVASLVSALSQGSSGDQVKVLQALLAADPSIYPEGKITGFYGQLTASAVKKYQQKHGLPQVGVVGPKTLQKLNKDLNDNPIAWESASSTQATSTGQGGGEAEKNNKRLCAIVPSGHLIAPGWLKKQGGERPIVPACQTLPPGILNKLSTSTVTSTVDVTPPVISGVTSAAASTTATVSWITSEPATSQISYGTSTVLGLSTALDSGLVSSHLQTISGLAASTTYYYSAQSKDGSGNLATSTQQSFMTTSQ